ncbi:MAG: M14 family metallopeptidase [Gammaproteobacteria bacterium]
MVNLNILDEVPAKLFSTPAEGLSDILAGPSLIHLQGLSKQALFLSVLLHGNETSGWNAVSRLLESNPTLPRDLWLFVGNVEAAATGVRVLPQQPDYNRIWCNFDGPEARLAEQLLGVLAKQELFAALDIHNNTGKNPHYSVLTKLDSASKGLAYLFSDKAVYIEEPNTVLSRALHDLCPATTVEVGPVGDPESDERAFKLLEEYFALSEIPQDPGESLKLHRSLARLHIPDNVEFDFIDSVPEETQSLDDLILTAGIEAVNFHQIPAGFQLGVSRNPEAQTIRVLNPAHEDVTDRFLEVMADGAVLLRKSVIPAMFTTDHKVVRQDCLGYFMEEIDQ